MASQSVVRPGAGAAQFGDVRLAIADVDLVTVSLQALISSVETAFPALTGRGPADHG